jgi:hypothetical protein
MYIQSDSHFNIVVELIDEIDEEQYVYSSEENGSTKRSSAYMYERQIFKEKNIVNYYQGETFPIKGYFCFVFLFSFLFVFVLEIILRK